MQILLVVIFNQYLFHCSGTGASGPLDLIYGGTGGYPSGTDGNALSSGCQGYGASQTAGGRQGQWNRGDSGYAGTFGVGGKASQHQQQQAGGGGGGFYGGGGAGGDGPNNGCKLWT